MIELEAVIELEILVFVSVMWEVVYLCMHSQIHWGFCVCEAFCLCVSPFMCGVCLNML